MTRERLKTLMAEYGRVAIGTYFGLFFLVLTGFALAISWGVDVTSAPAGVGVFGAAYIATKVTQPLRIAATLVLTPIVARFVERFRARKSRAPEAPGSASSSQSK